MNAWTTLTIKFKKTQSTVTVKLVLMGALIAMRALASHIKLFDKISTCKKIREFFL